jgi:hypothetical protein
MRTLFVRGFLVISVLVLTSLLTTSAQTVARSLDEWLGVQGTFCFPDGAGRCAQFFAPLPNVLG